MLNDEFAPERESRGAFRAAFDPNDILIHLDSPERGSTSISGNQDLWNADQQP